MARVSHIEILMQRLAISRAEEADMTGAIARAFAPVERPKRDREVIHSLIQRFQSLCASKVSDQSYATRTESRNASADRGI